MFFISATDIQINLDNAKIDFQNNNQGINMNTTDGINGNRYVEKFTANISNNSVVNCAKNKSNGFTGQAKNKDHPYIKPYLLNISNGSEVNASNNGGIGINNFFIIIKILHLMEIITIHMALPMFQWMLIIVLLCVMKIVI